MTAPASLPHAASRTAVTVMDSGSGPALCPFFGKCDGILLLDTDTGTKEFLRNPPRTPESLCDLILAAKPGRLVCGFVAEPEKRRLRAAGIDVRLGSCTCSPDHLAAGFCDLAEA